MRKVWVILSFSFLLWFSLSSFSLGNSRSFELPVYAQTPTDTPTPTPSPSVSPSPTPDQSASNHASELKNEIKDLQSKVSDLQNQAKTLASQIEVMDSQIKLTQLRINATTSEISSLTGDISTTEKKIINLEDALSTLTKVLVKRIVVTYEIGNHNPLELLVSSKGVSDFLARANYIKIAQEHDKKLLYETQQAKNDYANQKSIFEDKKKKVETLKAQLDEYVKQLDQDKKNKEALLKVTHNNEVVYQQRLQAALAEQQAINQISSGGGNSVLIGSVKEGDTIGHVIVGRSACSSGTHLHFEVHKNDSLDNPSNYLSNKNITFENSPDNPFSFAGSWSWPLSDTIRISQGYGMTYWARIGWYGGGQHTGIDMYRDTDERSDVHAVKDGSLYRGSISCGGGQLMFARVDQSDGVQVFYLHILP